MLTTDLLRTRTVKGEVRPRYVDPEDADTLALAERLIELFDEHAGRPRGELDAELRELTGSGTAFLLHRGLAKLLYDRCELETAAAAEPETLRDAVFTAAAAAWRAEPGESGESDTAAVDAATAAADAGVAVFRFDRQAVLAAAAADLGLEPAAVERGLYADLKSEQVLAGWRPCTPRWLVDRYNVALAQAVLLRATALTLRIRGQRPADYRALFRKVKFFQLLHRVEGDAGEGYTVRLDGPLSLFQASQRYGLKMASFLPTLLHFDGWRLEAELLWGTKRQRRGFRLSPAEGLLPYTRLTGRWQPDEVAQLAGRFTRLDAGWEVSTDGELIDLGGEGVLVPDLTFHHPASRTRALLEVFGFWNRGAVASRLALLRRHGPPNLILALSKGLAAGEAGLDELPGEVYVYARVPLAPKILERLEALRTGG